MPKRHLSLLLPALLCLLLSCRKNQDQPKQGPQQEFWSVGYMQSRTDNASFDYLSSNAATYKLTIQQDNLCPSYATRVTVKLNGVEVINKLYNGSTGANNDISVPVPAGSRISFTTKLESSGASVTCITGGDIFFRMNRYD